MILRDEQEGRELLVEYGKKLLAENLAQGTYGNLSVRLDDQFMLCTPSGMDYQHLKPEDMVKVNIRNLSFEGALRPTTERRIHAGIYVRRPKIGAVVHTHSKYCCIFAVARMPVQIENPDLAAGLGDVIPVADYGLPGSRALTSRVIASLADATGCILSNHGMIAVGADLFQAFERAKKIEQAATEYIDRRWETSLGR